MIPILVSKFMPFYYKLDDQSRYNVRIDSMASLKFGVFAGAFYPFFPAIAVRLGVTGPLLALITAAPFMGQLFAIYWSHRSDQGQKLPFVVWAGISSRFMIILLALVSKPEIYALFIILHYLLASISGPAYTSLVRKIYPLEFRGQILGRIHFIIGFVRVGISYLAGIWLDQRGYSTVFLIAGIAGVICSLIFSRIKEPQELNLPLKKPFSLAASLKLLKEDRLLKIAITGFFIFDLGNLILAPVYPIIRVNYLYLTNFQIGQLSIMWIVGFFATAPIWGWIVDHYRPLYAVLISIFLFIWAPLIYFLQSPFQWLLLASFVAGAAGSSLEVGWLSLMLKLGGDGSSQYSGIYLTVLGLRGLIGPLLGNLLVRFMAINQVFLVSIAFLLIGTLPFFMLYKELKVNQKAAL